MITEIRVSAVDPTQEKVNKIMELLTIANYNVKRVFLYKNLSPTMMTIIMNGDGKDMIAALEEIGMVTTKEEVIANL